jgi:hypothetical protein
MSRNKNRGIRSWPDWTIIPLGLVLAVVIIVAGMLLASAAASVSPAHEEAEPTMPTIAYSEGISEGCHDCHFSLSALEASAADPGVAGDYLIEAESIATPHGKLGCLACHGGDGKAADKDAGHEGLVADMSVDDPETCVICHEDMPNEFPYDRLSLPHGTLVERILKDEPCDVHCSDCHGGVGHGFDPVSGAKFCSMTVCLDCHQELNLEIQIADCDACHLGPHEAEIPFTCNDCHTSTEVWQEVEASVHPLALEGKHGETACFQCHQYPNFAGLSSTCGDCHESNHTDFAAEDCAGCHEPDGGWTLAAAGWDGHAELWDQYKGQHLKVSCNGCHFEGYDVDPSCTTCHKVPSSHGDGRGELDCTTCHQADQAWDANAPEG